MNVEEFVKETLKQISNATASLKEESKGSSVSPHMNVHFDLAVTSTNEKDASLSGGLQVASLLNFGGGDKTSQIQQEYNRVSFDLQLNLPCKCY